MAKLPDWFPLDVYQQDLSPMEWAFEIFIRINKKSKVDFLAENFPYSDSTDINVIYILSRMLKGFVFADACRVY